MVLGVTHRQKKVQGAAGPIGGGDPGGDQSEAGTSVAGTSGGGTLISITPRWA